MTNKSTATANTVTMWTASKDKYGRPVKSFYATHRGQWGTVAVVVTMPKAWVESHGDDRYLVSDWRRELAQTRPEPRYFRSLAAAKAYAESLVQPLTEDELADARPAESTATGASGPFTDHAGNPAQHPPIWR